MFKPLTFYFYPPRSVSRLNGVRATASSKHGAQISAVITPAVTHILVARGSDTVEFWKLVSQAPKRPGCLVLSSDWCSECIDQKRLIDPSKFICQQMDTNRTDQTDRASQTDNTDQTAHADRASETDNTDQTAYADRASQTNLEQLDHIDRADQKAKLDGEGQSGDQYMVHSKNNEKEHNNTDKDKVKIILASQSELQANNQCTDRQRKDQSTEEPENQLNNQPQHQPEHQPEYKPKSRLASKSNRKQMIIDMLHELLITRRSSGEEYSAKAYERALQALETQAPAEIHRGSDVAHLVSARMVQLVDQICEGKIAPSLVTKSGQSRHNIINLFCTVYGVGPHHARKLYDKGFRTLKQLMPVMDKNGQVSIMHHEDLIERMSRIEVDAHYTAVCKLAHEIDTTLELVCMGSYRRGKPDCGDIDIIVTKPPDCTLPQLTPVMDRLLHSMFEKGLATHTFSRHTDRWLGATQVRGKWRRMDILLVPSSELGAAVLYYTGSGEFNRQMRWIAKTKNMRLNHNGLFTSGGELLESQDEHRIFQLLDIPYREPKDR